MLRLYHSPLSPFCRKVRLCLAEKRVEAELVEEKYWERSADFLRRNPAGKVPILRIEGKTFTESMAICEYLEDIHPDPELIPKAAEERYEVRRLVAWFDDKFHHEVNHDLAILTKVLSRSNPKVPKECINTIALVRGPGMIVNYEFSNHLRNINKSFVSVAFGGTFAQSDEDSVVAERFFRNAENVKHDEWSASSAIRNLYPRGIVSHLNNEILRQMPKLVKILIPKQSKYHSL